MKNETFTGLFRSRKYGTWKPFEITVQMDPTKTTAEVCKEHLQAVEIKDLKTKKP